MTCSSTARACLTAGAFDGFLPPNDAIGSGAIPFKFPYFGSNFSTLYLSTNGFASVTSLSSSYFANGTIPTTTAPNGGLMPFWDDLSLPAVRELCEGIFLVDVFVRPERFRLAEAADRAIDKAWVEPFEPVPIQPELERYARPEILGQDVGGCDQPHENFAALGRLEVQGDRALAGIGGVLGGPILNAYPGLDADMLPLALILKGLGATVAGLVWLYLRRRPDEYELAQLFAAHASIALQNAAVHSAVSVRARTDLMDKGGEGAGALVAGEWLSGLFSGTSVMTRPSPPSVFSMISRTSSMVSAPTLRNSARMAAKTFSA